MHSSVGHISRHFPLPRTLSSQETRQEASEICNTAQAEHPEQLSFLKWRDHVENNRGLTASVAGQGCTSQHPPGFYGDFLDRQRTVSGKAALQTQSSQSTLKLCCWQIEKKIPRVGFLKSAAECNGGFWSCKLPLGRCFNVSELSPDSNTPVMNSVKEKAVYHLHFLQKAENQSAYLSYCCKNEM